MSDDEYVAMTFTTLLASVMTFLTSVRAALSAPSTPNYDLFPNFVNLTPGCLATSKSDSIVLPIHSIEVGSYLNFFPLGDS